MAKGGKGGGKPGGGGTAFEILGLDAASDDGTPDDDITSLNTEFTITGTFDGALADDPAFAITVYLNGDPYVLAASDIDAGTNSWSFTYSGDPLADGTITVDASYTYTHPKNGKELTSSATSYPFVIESGAGGNTDPVAVDDSATIDEDGQVTLSVLDNDSDGDLDTLSILSVTTASAGSVTNNGDGTITYTPDPDWSGTATFDYTISDGNGGTDTATVTITVNPVNDAPDAVDDDVTTDQGATASFNVLANDSDIDGGALSLVSVDDPANGSVSFSADGTVTYTPDAGFSGEETFTYTVSDGTDTSTATVTVTVNPVAQPNNDPTAQDDVAAVDEDGSVDIAVLANDSDIDGDTVSLSSVGAASHGSVTLNPDGTITYTPNADYNGSDSFTYSIDDGNGGTATATVSLTVNAVNDAPIAVDDSATTAEDTPIDIDVLANDSDIDGDTLSISAVTQGANGTVAINGGLVTYTPDPDFNGVDSFTYTVDDGNGGARTATVNVTVTSVNDAPVAADDSASTDYDTPVTIAVLGNDSDPDGDMLTVLGVGTAANGTVSLNGDGTITYTAGAGFEGVDSFTYTIDDGNGGQDSATVSVTVTAPPPPVEQNPYDDPLYGQQWHLTMIGDVQAVWEDYTGAGVSVGIYDNGIDYDHPDLAANYVSSKHVWVDGVQIDPAPSAVVTAEHGTAVAGVIAAADNDEGGVGVAFGASITGVNIFGGPADINGTDVSGFSQAVDQAYTFDVINNSWGTTPNFNNESDPSMLAALAGFELAVETGRGGLGTNVVKAAGNDYDSAQGDFLNASRYTITVAAHDQDGDASWYTNRGANVLVSAPSSGSSADGDAGILTTDETDIAGDPSDDEGYADGNYTYGFGGTSSATPVVTGVVALMLEANPDLGWRDVQSILAYSAMKIGNPDPDATAPVPADSDGDGVVDTTVDFPVEFFDWYTTAADDWNGGGLHFSEDYGFGGVDAYAATRMAEVWTLFDDAQTSANELSFTGALQTPALAFDNAWVETHYTYAGPAMELEYVEVYIDFKSGGGLLDLYGNMEDVSIELVSPEGTVVSLMQASNGYDSTNNYLNPFPDMESGGQVTWTYGVNALRGEEVTGDWTVRIVDIDDTIFYDGGTLNAFQFAFYGAAPGNDDVYHYTYEMLTLGLDADPSRVSLDDTGGDDWFDFSASGGDVVSDLSAGGITTLNGVTIVDTTAGTVIENAVGGDGNDSLTGNDVANQLAGMRGDDILFGGAGDDMFLFFDGNDSDWIGDFAAGAGSEDVIALYGTGYMDFATLASTFYEDGSDAVIDLGDGDMITLAGVAYTDLTADDFQFYV